MTDLGAAIGLVNLYVLAGSAGYTMGRSRGASVALWILSLFILIASAIVSRFP